jgi:chloride channel protein, CIC family
MASNAWCCWAVRPAARRDHHITREYVVDPFETLGVAGIMARPAEGLPGSWTVAETLSFFTAPDAPKRHKSYPVTDEEGRVIGMVARADALRWMRANVVQHEVEREALIRLSR